MTGRSVPRTIATSTPTTMRCSGTFFLMWPYVWAFPGPRLMPDTDARTSCSATPPETGATYRARASSLHKKADRAQSVEVKDNLDRVARWYEILARYVERRGNPFTS